MNIPDFLPVLSAGNHKNPTEGACFMEWASILAGEQFTDTPDCTDPTLTYAAQAVNDCTPDSERHQLARLIPSVIGTGAHDKETQRLLAMRLGVWAARFGMDRLGKSSRAEMQNAVDWAERQLDAGRMGNIPDTEWIGLSTYDINVTSREEMVCRHLAVAVYTWGPDFAHPCELAARAAVSSGRGVEFLEGLIEEFRRLTGHQPEDVSTDAWNRARSMVACSV